MKIKSIIILSLFVIVMSALVFTEFAIAGPGGFIAKALFETFWGKIVLVLLTIIFLPLIIYILAKEKIAEKRARKDLRYMSKYDSNFEWLRIKERASDCFYRIHSAWSKKDVSEAAEYMSDWYWKNQQLVFLDRWEREGLVNHCQVNKITEIKPVLFVHRNDGKPHEGSTLVISIRAFMKDYLAKKYTGEVVEGSKMLKNVVTIWSFTMTGDKWRVSNIEEDTFSVEYAKLVSELPRIEDTIINKSKNEV